MILIIAGLFLWTFAHVFKRVMPDRRAAMGDAGRGVIALAIFAGLVLMILGYRWSEYIALWYPPAFMVHVNNALMLLAFWVFGSSAAKGAKVWPANRIRHPQLTAVKIWALAHLLVNGDLASLLLFGGLLAWAVLEVVLINRAEPDWTPPGTAEGKVMVRLAVISLVLYGLVATLHVWLGVWPFPG